MTSKVLDSGLESSFILLQRWCSTTILIYNSLSSSPQNIACSATARVSIWIQHVFIALISPHILRPGSNKSSLMSLLWKFHRCYCFPLVQRFGESNGTPLQYSCLENPMDRGAWKAAVHGVAEGRTRLNDFTFTFHFHALEKEMATHSSVLAWRMPGTGEPSGLPSMGSHRVGHDWSDLAAVAVQRLPTRTTLILRNILKSLETFFAIEIGGKLLVPNCTMDDAKHLQCTENLSQQRTIPLSQMSKVGCWESLLYMIIHFVTSLWNLTFFPCKIPRGQRWHAIQCCFLHFFPHAWLTFSITY